MSEQEQQEGLSSLPAVYSRLVGEPGKQQASQHSKQSEWIWEYVLKNCNDYQITTKLLDAIPIPDTPLIKKLALLKLLTLDCTAATLSDRDLFALEGFQELTKEDQEFEEIVPELLLLLKAELALQHIRGGSDDLVSFNAAVERHWGEVVPDTEAQKPSDSIEELRSNLRSDLWSVKSNPRLKRFVAEEHKRELLEGTMNRFLEAAWNKVGPVFLERAEDDILHGRYVPSDAPVAAAVGDSDHPDVTQRKKKRIRKTLLASLDDQPAEAGAAGADDNLPPWLEENVKPEKRKLRRIHAEEEEEEEEKKQGEAQQSPRVERVLNELKQSQMNLKQQVVDPLPEAIEVAKNLSKEQNQRDDSDPAEPQQQQQQKVAEDQNGTKPKLTDRNPTARTHQWEDEDEIETSGHEQHSPSDSKRLNLPSTSTRRVSPLRKIEPVKASGHNRRRFTRWTATEEEALRRGVEQYGKGRWKAILQSYSHSFENRTEVDLKDKWRNIEKAEGMKR